MGTVGPVATLLTTLASFFMSESGYAQLRLRLRLAKLRSEADEAVRADNLADVERLQSELERLSNQA